MAHWNALDSVEYENLSTESITTITRFFDTMLPAPEIGRSIVKYNGENIPIEILKIKSFKGKPGYKKITIQPI